MAAACCSRSLSTQAARLHALFLLGSLWKHCQDATCGLNNLGLVFFSSVPFRFTLRIRVCVLRTVLPTAMSDVIC